jgi:hypothetical protein
LPTVEQEVSDANDGVASFPSDIEQQRPEWNPSTFVHGRLPQAVDGAFRIDNGLTTDDVRADEHQRVPPIDASILRKNDPRNPAHESSFDTLDLTRRDFQFHR